MSDILFIIAEVKQYLVLSKSNQINFVSHFKGAHKLHVRHSYNLREKKILQTVKDLFQIWLECYRNSKNYNRRHTS
jgi:hypothetical protein